jgi:hypothetical protein
MRRGFCSETIVGRGQDLHTMLTQDDTRLTRPKAGGPAQRLWSASCLSRNRWAVTAALSRGREW